MSDEQQDLNLEDVGAGAEDVSGPRRGGLLSGLLLTILKWAAIGIGAVIIVVTTTIITVRIVSKGDQPAGTRRHLPGLRGQGRSRLPPTTTSSRSAARPRTIRRPSSSCR